MTDHIFIWPPRWQQRAEPVSPYPRWFYNSIYGKGPRMQSPTFRVDILDGQTGEAIQRIPLDYAIDKPPFADWPIDSDTRAMIPTPTGYPLEIRVRRIL